MGVLQSLGYEQVTGMTSAKGLTVPGGATRALILCTAQNVRWRDDGTDPTATVGIRLVKDVLLEFKGDLGAIKFFQEAATAVLNVSYYS